MPLPAIIPKGIGEDNQAPDGNVEEDNSRDFFDQIKSIIRSGQTALGISLAGALRHV